MSELRKKIVGDDGLDMIASFEKVTKDQFHKDFMRLYPKTQEKTIEAIYKRIMLPTRATKGSAGYDFYTPIPISILPGETATIPTGVRAKIDDGWYLCIVPRSSLGFKYRMQLDNTCGIIDSDYYHADNEGHIMIKVTNDTKHGSKELFIEPGDRLVQGIFMQYGITKDDGADAERNGGFGSTGE